MGEGKRVSMYNMNSLLPYEKFMQYGPQAMSEAELLAIIIRTGTKEKNSLQIGEEILSLRGEGILGLCNLTLGELRNVDGIGEVKAVKLKCIAELSRRIWICHTREKLDFSRPATVAAYYMETLRHASKEQVVLLSFEFQM